MNIYVITKFPSGNLLIAINYATIRIVKYSQYMELLKKYPQ